MSRTFAMQEAHCPCCNHLFNRCSDPTGLDSPQAGDLSICIQCAELLKFDHNLIPQKLPLNELLRIQQEFPGDYQNILRMQKATRAINAKGGDRP